MVIHPLSYLDQPIPGTLPEIHQFYHSNPAADLPDVIIPLTLLEPFILIHRDRRHIVHMDFDMITARWHLVGHPRDLDPWHLDDLIAYPAPWQPITIDNSGTLTPRQQALRKHPPDRRRRW